MNHDLATPVHVSRAVAQALEAERPVVALETAVATHGLPEPDNLTALESMKQNIKAEGATPAVCLILKGVLYVGADQEQVAAVVGDSTATKASSRDVALALASRGSAGLTVSATLLAASTVGVRVFATGGIGGVHLGSGGDVSSDLQELARHQVVTVCSGAKSILDIPRTLEYLETMGVPVYGYGTSNFPGFYLREVAASVPAIHSSAAIGAVARAHWGLGGKGIVVANPIPASSAISTDQWALWLRAALESAEERGIAGKAVSPFLLSEVARASGGATVVANRALLDSNATLAARIAASLTP